GAPCAGSPWAGGHAGGGQAPGSDVGPEAVGGAGGVGAGTATGPSSSTPVSATVAWPLAPFVTRPSAGGGALIAASWKWGTDFTPSPCTGDPCASSTSRATSAPSMISLSRRA